MRTRSGRRTPVRFIGAWDDPGALPTGDGAGIPITVTRVVP